MSLRRSVWGRTGLEWFEDVISKCGEVFDLVFRDGGCKANGFYRKLSLL